MQDATEFLNRYYTTFSTLDLEAIAPFFNEPCLFISPQGVLACPTRESVKEAFKTIAEGLRAKGYGRSELANLNMKAMSETTVLATGTAVRYKADGLELEHVGVTYILQQSSGGLRIAVTVIHDAIR
jgi:ketosteroid isomerase-like protein